MPRSRCGGESVTKRSGASARGQHVASAAAADQNLAPAVGGPLEQDHRGRPAGRGDGRHQAGGTGADDDDGVYLKNSSIGTTRIGPRLSAAMPGSIALRSPTTTTAILSGWM